MLQKKADKIIQLGVNVVACREGIDDSVKKKSEYSEETLKQSWNSNNHDFLFSAQS